jgi:uncharacterized protein YkwD
MHQGLSLFAVLILSIALSPLQASEDPVGIVNAIRSTGCKDYAGVGAALRRLEKLNDAAGYLARGDTLEQATAAAGYRIKTAASIRIRTDQGDERVAELLAAHFCDDVANPVFEEIGVFRRGDETWMVLAEPFAPPRPQEMSAVARRVLDLVNEARSRSRRCGRDGFLATTPLAISATLERAALAHAKDMAAGDFIGHRGSDGSTPDVRADRVGYLWLSIGENVAAGQTDAEEVVRGWLDSPSHCSTLMDPRYTESGIAYALNPHSEHGIYWAQAFGRPR